MKASRRFLPGSIQTLEDRAVPSATAPHVGAHSADIRPVQLTAAEIAQSNASDMSFGTSASDTIHAGMPVAEQVTITYLDGSTQTESILKVPNPANNTVTTYETINLRNNGGIEKVVDTESFSGSTTPFSGTNNTHTITTTLPNGSVNTETYQEVITRNKTVVNGTIHEAGGGVETWTTTKKKLGPTTVANKMITEPDGADEHQKIITTNRGDLDSTTITKTALPDGSITIGSSATNVIRVQPPTT